MGIVWGMGFGGREGSRFQGKAEMRVRLGRKPSPFPGPYSQPFLTLHATNKPMSNLQDSNPLTDHSIPSHITTIPPSPYFFQALLLCKAVFMVQGKV